MTGADHRPPRVLVLVHTGAVGGAELSLARLLGAIDPTRFATSVLLFDQGPLVAELARRGVSYDVLPLDPAVGGRSRTDLVGSPRRLARTARDSWRFTERLATALRGSDADLVVANSLKAAVLGAVAAPRAGLPWVWYLHDRISPDYLPAPVVRALLLLARWGPRLVVVNSHDTAMLLGPQPAGRVRVAYPGLPAEAFLLEPGTGVRTGRVVGLLGRISATKGQREFVAAAARLAPELPDVEFRVIGRAMFNDHGYAAEVEALPARLGVADQVRFVGWADDPRTELRGLSVLVHASPVPEPFGQVIAEGMAQGVPVVATRGGGVSEILDPDGLSGPGVQGEATTTPLGQLVEPGDVEGLAAAIRRVLDDPQAAEQAARRARASAAERFGLGAMVEVVSQAWDQALCPPRRRWRRPSRRRRGPRAGERD